MNPAAHHVVVVGAGFGGLYAAKALGHGPVRVTVVDRRNFHLFQPLLYQVAAGSLSPGDIASPIRAVLAPFANIEVIKDEVVNLEPNTRTLILGEGRLTYDTLVIATGSSHSYFGHDEWAPFAPGLKSLEDALAIRRRILMSYERAEREPDARRRQALMTFVLVGAGPTGVELAGTLAELARATLKHDFRHIDPTQSRIVLVEGLERVLPTYPPSLSASAARQLEQLGVTVRTRTLVTGVQAGSVSVRGPTGDEQIEAATILWAAGVQVSPLGAVLRERAGASLDRAGRVRVQRDLSLPTHPEIFVIGDLACYQHGSEQPLPGIAPVAMQEGR
ncbi:MAG TPA: NAD(P)/FAD-dependent oxidoreductase, partial [Chloroflexota bacterium]|nr:NAD(P)/FAD-dependent oxidoreductase [Chloroflexota bacterium]